MDRDQPYSDRLPPPVDGIVDHICLCVRRIDSAAPILQAVLGYEPFTEIVENTRQMVNVQFFRKSGSLEIKLIEPSTPASPLVEHLKKHGPGLHHLAFRTNSLAECERRLDGHGVRIVASRQPGEAFDGGEILFAFLNCGLNTEFIETNARRNPI